MEDYIFLIIAVAISIFAAINKSQKNKLAEQSPEFLEEEEEGVERRNYFMDQLLGEDFLEEKSEKIEEPPMRVKTAPSKVVFKSSEEASKKVNYKLPRFKSTLPDRPKHVSIASTARKKIVEELQQEPEEAIDYLEDFSLRKAVVYSIILEPKYEMES